jgi:hypothetical protein
VTQFYRWQFYSSSFAPLVRQSKQNRHRFNINGDCSMHGPMYSLRPGSGEGCFHMLRS